MTIIKIIEILEKKLNNRDHNNSKTTKRNGYNIWNERLKTEFRSCQYKPNDRRC